MRSLTILFAILCAAPGHAALLLYDGFAPVTPDPGTEFNYRPGELLAPLDDTSGTPHPGQLVPAPYNVNWRYAGGGAAAQKAPGIASGSLNYPGLRHPVGNSVAYDTTQLGSARAGFTSQTSGTVYWSGLLRVNSISTLTSGTNGILLGGFNNAAGAGTLPTVYGNVLRIRKDATLNQYYIGTGLSAGTGSGVGGNIVQFDNATPRFEGETVFVVGAYQFVDGIQNDRAYLWINPSVATFMNNALEPAPSLTSAPGASIGDPVSSIASFNLRNVNTVGNPLLQFDELRVGTDWASVTPTPEPSVLLIMGFVGAVIIVAGKNRNKLQRLFT